MIKNYINKKIPVALLPLVSFLILQGCAHQKAPDRNHILEETIIDSNLNRLLQPVNRQVIAEAPVIKPTKGTRILSQEIQGRVNYDMRDREVISSRVTGRIEKLWVKYNYQPVRKGQLIVEIYSPELVAAQQELLLVSGQPDNQELILRAREKLKLLGMEDATISQLLRTRKANYPVPVYSPTGGYILEKPTVSPTNPMASNTVTNSPELEMLLREGQYVKAGQPMFTVYRNTRFVAEFYIPPSVIASVKKGQSLVYHVSGDTVTIYRGTIDLIQPTLSPGSSFTLVRAYLKNESLPYGQLLTAHLPVLYKGWWLPQSAVISLGERQLVFKKEKGLYHPRSVTVRVRSEGMVLVDDSVADWEVASHAAFLIDSESLIDPEYKLK